MAKAVGSALASVFDDDEVAEVEPAAREEVASTTTGAGEGDASPSRRNAARSRPSTRPAASPAARKDSHPGKKPVLIHIPADMHRTLRQLSVEEGGEPITKVVERSLREYLVRKGQTKFLKEVK